MLRENRARGSGRPVHNGVWRAIVDASALFPGRDTIAFFTNMRLQLTQIGARPQAEVHAVAREVWDLNRGLR